MNAHLEPMYSTEELCFFKMRFKCKKTTGFQASCNVRTSPPLVCHTSQQEGGKVLSPVPRPVFLLAQENSPQAYRKSYTQCLLVHVPFIRESKLTHKPQHRKKTSKITELKELKTLLLKLSVEVHRAELLKVMTKNMVP